MTPIAEIEKYINQFDADKAKVLLKIYSLIKSIAPLAEERLAYGMPGFYLNGPLIYFAAFKNHLGIYPTPSGIESFEKELKAFHTSKGAIQFPWNKPIPYDLIEKIILFRVKETSNRTK